MALQEMPNIHGLPREVGSPMERREFVRMMSLGGTALLAASGGGGFGDWLARFFGGGSLAFDLPDEWLDTLGPSLRGYSSFVGGLQLRRVPVKKVISPHTNVRGEVLCGLPPTKMWKKMQPTLLMLDEVGSRLGEDVETIISAYRSPSYNAKCPGAARNSKHMENIALDVRFGSSPATVSRVAREVRKDGKFIGGVGTYSTFTHIDTRGTAADW